MCGAFEDSGKDRQRDGDSKCVGGSTLSTGLLCYVWGPRVSVPRAVQILVRCSLSQGVTSWGVLPHQPPPPAGFDFAVWPVGQMQGCPLVNPPIRCPGHREGLHPDRLPRVAGAQEVFLIYRNLL